jgi:hypothetical protein
VKAAAHVFLSYAREDEEKVEYLYQKLSDAGFKPWMDTKDILPGENWKSSIQRAVRRSDFFLACLSANSVNKRGFLQRENRDALDIWQEKLDSDIYLIPVRLEDCDVPEKLRDFQWVNLFEEDGWTRLVKAMQVGMERQAEVSKPLVRESTSLEPYPTYDRPFPGMEKTIVQERPESVWDNIPDQIGGDVIIGEVGTGAKGVAIGKNITQAIYDTLGEPTPDDRQVIEQKLSEATAAVQEIREQLDSATATMAEFQLKLLQGELTKTEEGETPSASTITQVGDWLLDNVPQIAEILVSLFATPAVGRVVGKAGEVAVVWAKKRFGRSA